MDGASTVINTFVKNAAKVNKHGGGALKHVITQELTATIYYMVNNLCCELNTLIQCDSCGIKYCSPCHDRCLDFPEKDRHTSIGTVGPHHRFRCDTTGEFVCQEGKEYAQHVTKCIHILEVQPQEGYPFEIKENI